MLKFNVRRVDRRGWHSGFCWNGSLFPNRLSSLISLSPRIRNSVWYTTTYTNTRRTDSHFSYTLRQPRAATKSRHLFSVRRALEILSIARQTARALFFLTCTSTRCERTYALALEARAVSKGIGCLITLFHCSRVYLFSFLFSFFYFFLKSKAGQTGR